MGRRPLPEPSATPTQPNVARAAIVRKILRDVDDKQDAAETAMGSIRRSTHFGLLSLDGKYQVKDDKNKVQFCFKSTWEWSCHPKWEIDLYRALGYEIEEGPEGPYSFNEYVHRDYDVPCETCGGTAPLPGRKAGAHLLICQGCETAWHGRCLDPPLDCAPEGD